MSRVIILIAVIFLVAGCCPENHYRIEKNDMMMVHKGCATNEPSVFEYKRDGVTYLVFKDGNGLAVIKHQ